MSCSIWLKDYPNNIMVETGSGGGGGIQNAIKYGFKHIYSIEIDKEKYLYCKELFKSCSNVHLYLGDSADVLPSILDKIKENTTFLLDAHIMDMSQIHGKDVCPVIKEIEMIINHGNKLCLKHSILIDDSKFFNGKTETFGNISGSEIKKIITDMNSQYTVHINRRMIVAT